MIPSINSALAAVDRRVKVEVGIATQTTLLGVGLLVVRSWI